MSRLLNWSVVGSTTAVVAATIFASGLLAQSCGEWEEAAAFGPGARTNHAMAYDSARNVTVLFGGTVNSADTWEWNGLEWTLVSQLGPSPRRFHAMVYDSARGVIVLFGGRSTPEEFGDTWEWDGVEWVQVANDGPSARSEHAMAYDGARGVTVLFGGSEGGLQRFGDTWEWNGAEWIQVANTGPSPRANHDMAYDIGRGATVLFGGSSDVERLGDTWEWDGIEWRQAAETGPSARGGPKMTFDTERERTILFGGLGGPRSGETWEWDGARWSLLAESGPSARNSHALTYDSARHASVLYGGNDGSERSDTWEWRYSFWLVAHPVDAIVGRGMPVEFRVGVDGPEPVEFQWRRDGVPLEDGGSISGSRTDTLTISRVFRADAGVYDCVVRGDCGEIASRGAMLYVVDPALEVASTCPDGGPIIVSWQHASPQKQVALIFSLGTGRFSIPQGFPCEGTRLGLAPNQIQVAWQGSAGVDGCRTINGSAGPNACGGYLQLLDLTACETSNVVRIE